MDKINYPFSPGAGSPPPGLAGRDDILEQARVLIGRVRTKRPEYTWSSPGQSDQEGNDLQPCAWGYGIHSASFRRIHVPRYTGLSAEGQEEKR